MAKKKTQAPPEHYCRECQWSKPFYGDEHDKWNCDIYGNPITLHCFVDSTNIVRGIFMNAPACSRFKKRNDI